MQLVAPDQQTDFESPVMAQQSLLAEFLEFLRIEKRRWLTPILLAALLLASSSL